jgi:hypothetical protein
MPTLGGWELCAWGVAPGSFMPPLRGWERCAWGVAPGSFMPPLRGWERCAWGVAPGSFMPPLRGWERCAWGVAPGSFMPPLRGWERCAWGVAPGSFMPPLRGWETHRLLIRQVSCFCARHPTDNLTAGDTSRNACATCPEPPGWRPSNLLAEGQIPSFRPDYAGTQPRSSLQLSKASPLPSASCRIRS